jgi:hypothetical protein
MMRKRINRRSVRMLGCFVVGVGLAACGNTFNQEGNGNICANQASCSQGAAASPSESAQAVKPSDSRAGNADPSQPVQPSVGASTQGATVYQQVSIGTLCQNADDNNFFDTCSGTYSAELGGHVYAFTGDALVGTARDIVKFTSSTCKSLSLRLGIPPNPNSNYPANLQMTLTLVQGSGVPQKQVTVPLDRLVTWTVPLDGAVWELDGSANNTTFYWALYMDGTAVCSTPTGVSGS